jgi:hypothetical protein
VGDEVGGLHLGMGPRFLQRAQCGWRGLRRRTAVGLEENPWRVAGFRFTLPRVAEGALGALYSGLRRHLQLALGHPVVTQGIGNIKPLFRLTLCAARLRQRRCSLAALAAPPACSGCLPQCRAGREVWAKRAVVLKNANE